MFPCFPFIRLEVNILISIAEDGDGNKYIAGFYYYKFLSLTVSSIPISLALGTGILFQVQEKQ